MALIINNQKLKPAFEANSNNSNFETTLPLHTQKNSAEIFSKQF